MRFFSVKMSSLDVCMRKKNGTSVENYRTLFDFQILIVIMI